ncbi:RICIN domain-containing protein [Kitasatospora sp. NBC_01302]|uniref:RICIN domain-containing protein n=1 Tax=Kitasatospora sp. NBC_01302 TaxID=2903575 RepID=UPI002E15ED2F|nr:ricin-type beta-trefoil lectin domain protein [Kitasatospora sp. NBC_01302]
MIKNTLGTAAAAAGLMAAVTTGAGTAYADGQSVVGTPGSASATSHQVNWDKGRAPGTRAADATPAAGPVSYVRIYSLYRPTPNQCLDADATNGGDGTRVQAWACNGSTQQEWLLSTDGSLQNVRFPGMCLDADTNGAGNNGTRVQLWQCNGTTQQEWYHPSGDLAIYNVRFNNNNNTVLDRNATVAGNGAPAQLWAKNFQSQQWWDIRTA